MKSYDWSDIKLDLVDIFDLLYSSNGSLIQLDGLFINRDVYDQKNNLHI